MKFEREYYINSRISAYEDYTRKDYSDLADNLIKTLDFRDSEVWDVLDYGCAIGALVYELRKRDINTIGTDLSYWAIKYGRVRYGLGNGCLQHFNRELLARPFSYCIFFDVLEHIDTDEIAEIFSIIKAKSIVVRVPVVAKDGEDYVLDIHKIDKTHVQRRTKEWWEMLFQNHGYQWKWTFNESSIYDTEGVLARVYARNN